ncbi:unnamed protein product [Adineta ricciae]|uniref:G-protein coupled receptors family 1 profile domain-containing protein n=1 Tax=Adineta ricciae TaxID=249248 RepID=A0A815TQ37_ADIRI|nr:unnamed protein product [Adineta ricciae]CAF1509608.1 unnamed protein product [Adineta ricciae]
MENIITSNTPRNLENTVDIITINLVIYGGIFLLLIGNLGCIGNIFVFRSRKYRGQACFIYLFWETIASLFILNCFLLTRILETGFNISWRDTSDIFCKIREGLSLFMYQSENTMFLFAILDRILSAQQSNKLRQWSNRVSLAYKMITGNILVWLPITGHRFIFYTNVYGYCWSQEGLYRIFDTYLDVSFSGVGSPLLVIILTVLLWFTVHNVNKRRTVLLNHTRNQDIDSQLTIMLFLQLLLAIINYVPYGIGYLYYMITFEWTKSSFQLAVEQLFYTIDNRGGINEERFYDTYLELESLEKLYALDECERKSASFASVELASYLDHEYYKLTGETKTTKELIRSEQGCCRDLHRCGCKFDKNTAKPYWADHERPDVVDARIKFVKNFVPNQDKYYRVEEGKDLRWNIPKKNGTVLICQDFFTLLKDRIFLSIVDDESCFRSGETSAKRWFYSGDTISFFNRDRGRSLMVSDFLIAHPENSFFQLSQDEWTAAVKKYPELIDDDGIQYIERSVSGSIQVDYGGYFDNDAVINQFTRLFKMLPFRKAYNNRKFHVVVVVVGNARTHSTKQYSVEDFRMKLGTRCSTEKIFYRDRHGKQLTIDCFSTTGVNKGQSKDLLNLAKELGIDSPPKVKLEELKLCFTFLIRTRLYSLFPCLKVS